MLILASTSPRRAELLRAAGIEFRVVAPVMEEMLPLAPVRAYSAQVKRAAVAKAESAPRRGGEMVLGADTIVVCGGEVLGKPASEADARRMLALLSGQWHAVYTGLALVWDSGSLADYERTEVAFRRLSREEISRYVKSREARRGAAGASPLWMDKAGGYAIQGKGAALVRAVRGCYTNVIGLPIPKLVEMLARVGGKSPTLHYAARSAAPGRGEGRGARR
jgi:septum formation protein